MNLKKTNDILQTLWIIASLVNSVKGNYLGAILCMMWVIYCEIKSLKQ